MEATYAAGRRILDCDAHIMEPPGWLESYASSRVRDQLPVMDFGDPAFVAKIKPLIETLKSGAFNVIAELRADNPNQWLSNL